MQLNTRRGGEFLLGALAGAAVMFLLDPSRGNRRRALARDKLVHAGHELEHLRGAAAARARDLRNRARGVVAEARRRMAMEPVDDDILLARVRSRLGHHMARPGNVELAAQGGTVTLSGSVLPDEAERLVTAVAVIPGVRDVVDRLRIHTISGPQGNGQVH
jgi:hypothetical protein